MPYAVTHVILTIVLLDILRHRFFTSKWKRKLNIKILFYAGIGGLLPDIDIIFTFINSPSHLLVHGGILHTPIIGILLFCLGFLLLSKNEKRGIYLVVVSYGYLFHIFLDWFLGGGSWEGIMFFWPFSTSPYKFHLLLNLGMLKDFVMPALDAIILLTWLYHEEKVGKIRDWV